MSGRKYEVLCTFRVKEVHGAFDYRAVRGAAGGYRLDKRGVHNTGNWQSVLKSCDEQALARAYQALIHVFGATLIGKAPVWMTARLGQ